MAKRSPPAGTPAPPPASSPDGAVLLKLRPSLRLQAAESRANLRPLHETPEGFNAMMGIGADPQWFLADLPEGAQAPWDLAHARVADQLGIDASDVIFAEPDLVHGIYIDTNELPTDGFAVGSDCKLVPQDAGHGKATGPDEFAWHLRQEYSQLGPARDSVVFAAPRTRIAHLDTGYYPKHRTVPEHVLRHLERNFVSGDRNTGSASDPDNRKLLIDNSGHGTGTIGILAGRDAPDSNGVRLGGAPDAEVLPLRIADRVVLLRTSAFAQALQYALDQGCDVVTMSMGGLPSRAWSEHVDRAYLGGLCIVAAAGNNANGLPTRNLVYPARYSRVIAACGVMANDEPYAGLKGATTLEGNFGPDQRMTSAISAYTPNICWPQFGCPDHTRRNGEGTSSATPQVAAAVALWYERYKTELPRDWRRVEAVRHALFTSAKNQSDLERLGRGIIQAADALAVRPVLTLKQTKADNDSFAFLRVLTGLGIAEPPPRERMFNLELAQLWMVSAELQELVPDPDDTATLEGKALREVMEAVIEDPRASRTLRRHLANRYTAVAGDPPRRVPESEDVVAAPLAVCPAQPEVRDPAHRRLRVYASDPSFSTRLDTADTNEVTLKVRWETFDNGKADKDRVVGDYLIVDTLDATGETYDSVVLDDPRLLAQDGWAPSEGNPQFHQQMVYAVAMKTIEHFERALGRPVLWRPKRNTGNGQGPAFVGQLLMRPHALRQPNAYYSPDEGSIKFGYFEAAIGDPGALVPETRVYTCLSHDIIAHETTHAILDGMQQRFNEPSNPDVLALHEGFADIVALFQHFTIGEILEREIARTRGNLEEESILGRLAVQFGQATGGRGALRDAIGTIQDGKWQRIEPDPNALHNLHTPHARGAILVAAVFDAFIAIYKTRTADLLRIYTGGTGELKGGAIHPDLVKRLADEAAKAATHVLNMCIRAIDYVPPVDVTFFEYLRGLITADSDLVRDDRLNYRVAFVEAFRRRGIYPVNLAIATDDTLRTISADTLRWSGFNLGNLSKKAAAELQSNVLEGLKKYADQCFYLSDRDELFEATLTQRKALQKQLRAIFKAEPSFAKELGIDDPATFEVHDLRRAMRTSPDGQHTPQLVVALTQETTVPANAADGTPAFRFHGGSTLVIDLARREIKYRIVKNIGSKDRRARAGAFAKGVASDPLRALFLGADRTEPFAVLHSLAEDAR